MSSVSSVVASFQPSHECTNPYGSASIPASRSATKATSDRVDRALAPAVSIVPIQLLAWRLAVERGRAPGELTRAAKVTTHE